MTYHKKYKETLPLLSSFGLLFIIGVAIFSFSQAGAALVIDTNDTPPNEDATVVTENSLVDTFLEDTVELPVEEMMEPYVETVEPDVYNHAYFAANQVVNARGTFENDVYVAGETVTITGTVAGNVFAAGNTVTIDASVGGSVWVAGNTVVINNAVRGNVMAFGSNVTITENGYIGKDLTIGAANVAMAGFVMGEVTGGGEQVTITGKVQQAVKLDEVDKLTVDKNAWIGGDLTYSAETEANLPEQAIGGKTIFTQDTADQPNKAGTNKDSFSLGWFLLKLIIGLVGYLLLGLVLIKLMPKKLVAFTNIMLTKSGASLGYGALYLFVTPAAIMIAALTLIGLPLAAVVGLFFIITLFIAKIAVGLTIGKKLLSKSGSLFTQFALGFSLIYIVVKILSQAGFILHTLVSLVVLAAGAWATGAMILQFKRQHE